jgi:hypothetical protein
MGHPDFRVGGRIFATLAYPDTSWGMLTLPLEEQARLVEGWPEAFQPAAGAWGRQGSTLVRLAKARTEVVAGALQVAWAAARTKPGRRRTAR